MGFFAMVGITMTSTDSTDSALVFRPAEEVDREFIHEMHRQAETWGDESRELGDSFEEDDHHYVGKWTPDQGGVIVEEAGRRIGAAWLRNFTADNPGTGYVADELKRLGIAEKRADAGVWELPKSGRSVEIPAGMEHAQNAGEILFRDLERPEEYLTRA